MRVATRLLLLAGLLCAGGACVSDPTHHWAETRFVSISYDALFSVVATTIDGEGFPVRRRNTVTGEIETDWVYGTSLREVRGPSRRKVYARVEIDEATGGFVVRLRVAEEVLRKQGELATHIRNMRGWEKYGDNWDDAAFLMAKLGALLHDYRYSVVVVPGPARADERDLQP